MFLTALYFLFFLCNFVQFLLIRADEQEKLDANSTIIQNGQNVTQELNTDFYLGVYGGNLKRHIYSAQCGACSVWCFK